jgi:hypothetical protein
MKSLVSSLAVAVAVLSAAPTVLTLANPSSAAEALTKTAVYQIAVQPATNGGTIAEQFNQQRVQPITQQVARPITQSVLTGKPASAIYSLQPATTGGAIEQQFNHHATKGSLRNNFTLSR